MSLGQLVFNGDSVVLDAAPVAPPPIDVESLIPPPVDERQKLEDLLAKPVTDETDVAAPTAGPTTTATPVAITALPSAPTPTPMTTQVTLPTAVASPTPTGTVQSIELLDSKPKPARTTLTIADAQANDKQSSNLLLPFRAAVAYAKQLLSSDTFQKAGAFSAALLAAVVKALPHTSGLTPLLTVPTAFRLRKSVGSIFLATRWMQVGYSKLIRAELGKEFGIKIDGLTTPIITLAQQLLIAASADLIEEAMDRVLDAIIEAVGARPSAKTIPKFVLTIVVAVVSAVAMTGVTAAPNTLTIIFMLAVHLRRRSFGWWEMVKLLTFFNYVHESVVMLVKAVEAASNVLALKAYGGGVDGTAATMNTVLSVERVDLTARADFIEAAVLPRLRDTGAVSEADQKQFVKALARVKEMGDPSTRLATRDVSDDASRTVQMRVAVEAVEADLRDAIVKANVETNKKIGALRKELVNAKAAEAKADEEEKASIRMTQETVQRFYMDVQARLGVGEMINPLMFSGTVESSELPGVFLALTNAQSAIGDLRAQRDDMVQQVAKAAAERRDVEDTLSKLTQSVMGLARTAGYEGPSLERGAGQSVSAHAMRVLSEVEETAKVFRNLAQSAVEGKSGDAEKIYLGKHKPFTMEELEMSPEQRNNAALKQANGLIRDLNSISEGLSDLARVREQFADHLRALQQAVSIDEKDWVSSEASDKVMKNQAMRAVKRAEELNADVADKEQRIDKVVNAFMSVDVTHSNTEDGYIFSGKSDLTEFQKVLKDSLNIDGEQAKAMFENLRWRSAILRIENATGRSMRPAELMDFLNRMANEFLLSGKEYLKLKELINGSGDVEAVGEYFGDVDDSIPAFKRFFLAVQGSTPLAQKASELPVLIGRLADSAERVVDRDALGTIREKLHVDPIVERAWYARMIGSVTDRVGLTSARDSFADSVRGDLKYLKGQVDSLVRSEMTPSSIAQIKKEIETSLSELSNIVNLEKERAEDETIAAMFPEVEKDIDGVVESKVGEVLKGTGLVVPSSRLSDFAARIKKVVDDKEIAGLSGETRAALASAKDVLDDERVSAFFDSRPDQTKMTTKRAYHRTEDGKLEPLRPSKIWDQAQDQKNIVKKEVEGWRTRRKPSDYRRVNSSDAKRIVGALQLLNDIVGSPAHRAIAAVQSVADSRLQSDVKGESKYLRKILRLVPFTNSVTVSQEKDIKDTVSTDGGSLDTMRVLQTLLEWGGKNTSDRVVESKHQTKNVVATVFDWVSSGTSHVTGTLSAMMYRGAKGVKSDFDAAIKDMKEARGEHVR